MNRKDFITFLKVAETGSVTLAAELLGRSQSSVTRCLQDLDTRLGFDLFERVGRRISLTAEGVAFEEEARRMLAMLDDLPARTRARASQTEQPLTISATYALGTGLVPQAIARWPAADRPREIRLMQAAPNAVGQDLRSGNARIGLASLPLDVPGVKAERLYSAPLVVALAEARAAEFPEGEAVSLADLGKQTVVTMLDQTRLQGRIRQALDTAGMTPERTIRANSSVAALQLARLADSIAIVEPITAYGATPEGVVLRPLVEPIDFTFGFFAAEGADATRSTQTFFDLCEDTLEALIPHIRRIDGTSLSET
ncbi:LysR family transcriptional regulator [Oceanicola sp. 502str15]|uniref:LysR family transcriptional regulator n=1 Tax=Oceanicola sp. 502str15 TaxID=2696061 RepID=UPI0020945F14|nr:LysR family transcriptional regulator [Oceanicola sp. 502str15]MCO6383304.1 LysR family transcriptional regulator [Oceanicola sp. 502str15]